MSWIQKLYDTYENCKSEVGIVEKDDRTPLLPIAHSTRNAQIEIVLNGDGAFKRSRVLKKYEQMTIIPVTEDSATRGNGIMPHPLCDKLQYVAGDYTGYVVTKKGLEFYNKYIEQLERWCKSPYSNLKVNAILIYLRKKVIMADLIGQKILVCDDSGNLSQSLKIGLINQKDAFIRFNVEISNEDEPAIWLDKQVYESYIKYYLSLQKCVDLCYVKGQKTFCSTKHPAKIRNTADTAKLISANDKKGFIYRGRFASRYQAMSIGYETSQKAHNALRWLIDKQGYKNCEQVVIVWDTKNRDIPLLLEDTQWSIFGKEKFHAIASKKEFSKNLNRSIANYRRRLDATSEIVIMGLDAATIGRLSITYYHELNGYEYLNRIKHWHSTCSWKHTYKTVEDGIDENGKPRFKYITFIGAPSPEDISIAAYGNTNSQMSKKLNKSTVERLIPCIIDGAKLPYDIVNSAVNRVSSPSSMGKLEWQKSLTITCAMVRKYRYDRFEEVWEMALDEKQTDRSYIFGRLLAIAQQIEEYALYTLHQKRETNAERLMHQFRLRPYKTWTIITDKLKPYITRLGSKGTRLTEIMIKVNSIIPYDEFISQDKLNDSYILGYCCQRQIFIDERNKIVEKLTKK